MVCDDAYKQNEIRKDGFAHKWKMFKLSNGLYDQNKLDNQIQEYFFGI
jgi:hypothetical protein